MGLQHRLGQLCGQATQRMRGLDAASYYSNLAPRDLQRYRMVSWNKTVVEQRLQNSREATSLGGRRVV